VVRIGCVAQEGAGDAGADRDALGQVRTRDRDLESGDGAAEAFGERDAGAEVRIGKQAGEFLAVVAGITLGKARG
jgi:hypothetical protein